MGAGHPDIPIETDYASYSRVRRQTLELCKPLEPEDYVVQTMPDVSPTKWHLGHTSWFFEAIVLRALEESYAPYDERFDFIFNSYYERLGARIERSQRGLLCRPTTAEILAYRREIDRRMERLIDQCGDDPRCQALITIALNHEQQHQELLLTDITHVLAQSPMEPVYAAAPAPVSTSPALSARVENGDAGFVPVPGGIYEVGTDAFAFQGDLGSFAYDNESPRHRAFVEPFEIHERTVTNGDYLEFIADGGYRTASLWLSDAWAQVRRDGWQAPLYWRERDGQWSTFTLHGRRPIDPERPACHVSYYEADAYARWRGARLPTEVEWEIVAGRRAARRGSNLLRTVPRGLRSDAGDLQDLFGNVWEWTASAYAPYPGYRAFPGDLAEYNGKFMCGQMVLRGGSFATPHDHIRVSYRNFFYPDKRWQFSGIRLAR